MKKWKIIMFTTLWALGIASLFLIGSSNANFGSWSGQKINAMQSISTNSTYQEFIDSIEGTRMEWKVTEEQFNEMKTKHTEREQRREAVAKAIQNHDYKAWKELHEWTDILGKIDTEAKFEKLIEMHSIMETAKDKADAIAKELWIERWMWKMMGEWIRLWDWEWMKMWRGEWMWMWGWKWMWMWGWLHRAETIDNE